MKLLHAGECEAVKRAAHVSLGLCAALCALYNLAAYVLRRERHLAVNVGFYGLIVVVECAQVRRHGP